MNSRYRSSTMAGKVIALSISYEKDNLLARGMGLEHLRELLVRLARPLLRRGASLAYGGNWQHREDNFTFDLLRLISAEQQDSSAGGRNSAVSIGRLYNHVAWPYYLDITPRLEAQWINCARIIRITQGDAGIPESQWLETDDARGDSDRLKFNRAVVLTAMRRLATDGMSIPIAENLDPETIPRVAARIALGGRSADYSGFLPGIFEEALLTLEQNVPLYLLGGFGGTTEALAEALIHGGSKAFTLERHRKYANVAKLQQLCKKMPRPKGVRTTAEALKTFSALAKKARRNLAGTLKTGLSNSETRDLMTTSDMNSAARLVMKGLSARMDLDSLPS